MLLCSNCGACCLGCLHAVQILWIGVVGLISCAKIANKTPCGLRLVSPCHHQSLKGWLVHCSNEPGCTPLALGTTVSL